MHVRDLLYSHYLWISQHKKGHCDWSSHDYPYDYPLIWLRLGIPKNHQLLTFPGRTSVEQSARRARRAEPLFRTYTFTMSPKSGFGFLSIKKVPRHCSWLSWWLSPNLEEEWWKRKEEQSFGGLTFPFRSKRPCRIHPHVSCASSSKIEV